MKPTTAQVWERFGTDLRAFFRRRGPADAAEDLVQETFVRIHQDLPGLRAENRLGPWVYRIARHVLIDHLRRPVPDLLEEEAPAATDNLNGQVGQWLRSMVGSLPPTYRRAVEMAELENKSQKEVAAALGLSLSGAKSRVQRGRRMLRDHLERCCRLELDRRGNIVDYAHHTAAPCCEPSASCGPT